MQYVNCALGLVLLVLAALQSTHSQPLVWMSLYGAGALLAGAACKPRLELWTLRVLAIAATVTMFIYFAGFFFRAPYLGSQWYANDGHGATLALLIGGFCMMPVVSAYSCRMKTAQAEAG